LALIGTIVGPPLVDYLTQPDDEPEFTVDSDSTDAVEAEYLARIKAEPNDASAMAGLGSYLGQTGRVDEAIPWYEKALALEPENTEFRYGFGVALSNGDKRQDAELQFKKVIEAEPNNAPAHFALGQLYQNWVPSRNAEAISEYQIVISLVPDSFLAQRAREELTSLGVATPISASPVASPAAVETGP
jgi:tetratricopeptide (TPR) repeat protein